MGARQRILEGYSDVICLANDEQAVIFIQEDDYSGDWLLVTYSGEESSIKVYKDYFGSCSGCDNFEATFSYGCKYSSNDPLVKKFVKDYSPFIVIPVDCVLGLIEKRVLGELFPRNLRGDVRVNFDSIIEKVKEFVEENFQTSEEGE